MPAAPASHHRPRGSCTGPVALVAALALLVPQHVLAEPAAEEPPPGDALPTVTDEPEPPPDDSGTSEDLQRAMRAFESGSENYNKAKYKEALSDFTEAASLYASPDFQYNIGLCYEKLDKPEEAIRAFEIYLKTKRDIPDRANVEDRITRLRAMAEAREREAKQPVDAEPKPVDDAAERRKAKALVGAGAALTAVGAAVALGGGLGLGIAAKRKSDDLDAIGNGNPDDLTFADAQDLERDGKRLEVGQIAVVAVGAAVGLVGIALVAVGAQRMRKGKRGPKAALAPSFGGRAFGLSLLGRF